MLDTRRITSGPTIQTLFIPQSITQKGLCTMKAKLSITLIMLLFATFLPAKLMAKPLDIAQEYQISTQERRVWQGEIQGHVFGQPFQQPVVVEIGAPLPHENNPMNLFIGVPDVYAVGSLGLYSALPFTSPSGGEVTLQYFTLTVQNDQIKAVLSNDHMAEAAVANQFTAPNVSAHSAPPIMQDIYRSLGLTEFFAFREGTQVSIKVDGSKLTGHIYGTGGSIWGIFPTPDVTYEATFVATRVR